MAYSITPEPSSSSYRESGHDGLRLFHVDSGPQRMRKDKANSNPVIELTWDAFYLDYIRLMNAYNDHRHEEWSITLASQAVGYGTYICRLIPDTFGWRLKGDVGYTIFCSVEVMESPKP